MNTFHGNYRKISGYNMKDPLTDSEFMDIDDKLYELIEKALEIGGDRTPNWSMNGDKELFDWYCEIRNNLCEQIHNKKEELKTKKERRA